MKQFFILLAFCCISSASLVAQDATPIIKRYLLENQQKMKLNKAEAADGWRISDQYLTKHNQVTQVYVQQMVNGLKLFNAISSVAVKDGTVQAFNSRFTPNATNLVNVLPGMQRLNAKDAIMKAASSVNVSLQDLQGEENKSDMDAASVYTSSAEPGKAIKTALLYKSMNSGIRLAWNVEFQSKSDWWHIRVDAVNGEILDKGNYTVYCEFEPGAYSHQHEHDLGETVPSANNALEHPDNLAAGYRVFPYPAESPLHGNRQFLSDPADPTASPFGWHDTDGIAGADYTITRGNNVFASEDRNDDNVPGHSPDGGANLLFDFPYNPGQAPTAWEDAAITNLFYANNFLHDMTYHYGFDEVAGNFQENNYGLGGNDGDAVQADAQDGSGTNNANFSTPSDGNNGRMQMYIWDTGEGGNNISVNSPASIAGNYDAPVAAFGPVVVNPITADVVIVEDNTAPTANGCETIVNAAQLNGKIVLIDRGSCLYELKVKSAQDAGAVGVLIVNFSAASPFIMTGSSAGINIPAVMISKAAGLKIRTELATGPVNVTILPTNGNLRDSDMDNGVIAHEFGHGISTRLTGGPSNSSCLNNLEQMGEGWGDFYALVMTIRPNDTRTTSRAIGNYSYGEGISGRGIRNKLYSTSMSVNNYTYSDLPATGGEEHNVGEIWATMLWDLTWDLIDVHGFEPNLLASTGGNNIAQQLVTDGYKLQQCNPGFVDGRDAILLADQLNYKGAHQCLIWKAFARRGLGYSAKQGSSASIDDGIEAFDLPPTCQVATLAPIAAFTVDRRSSCLELATFQFTDESQNLAQFFLWDFGDGTFSAEADPIHTYMVAGNYTVTLKVTNNIASDTKTEVNYITVGTLPTPVVDDVAICTGSNLNLEVTPSSAGNTMEWRDADGNIVFIGTTFNPLALNTATYSVNEAEPAPLQKVGPQSFGTGGNHDSQSVRKLFFTSEKAVTILSALVRAEGDGEREIRIYDDADNVIRAVIVNIPDGDSRIKLNFDIPGPGNYSIGAGPSINLFRNNAGVAYPYSIPGLISITGSSNGANAYYYFYDLEVQQTPCRSAADNVTVTVSPGPLANFDVLKNGLEVSFGDLSTGNPSSWHWDFGDGTSSDLPNPIHTFPGVGTYTVELTVSNGICSSTYVQTVDFTTGISTLNAAGFNVQLSPNPATSLVNLTLSGSTGGQNVEVGLYGADGRLMNSGVYDSLKSDLIQLDLKGFAAGVYFVKVQASAGLVIKKLVIE